MYTRIVRTKTSKIWKRLPDEKEVRKVYTSEDSEAHAKRESEVYTHLMRNGKSDRILRCSGLTTDSEGFPALALENAKYLDMEKYIRTHSKSDKPDMLTRLRMARQFAEGVAYLHSEGVTWNNGTNENALVLEDLTVVVADFKTSSIRADDDLPNTGKLYDVLWMGNALYEITEWEILESGGMDREDWNSYKEKHRVSPKEHPAARVIFDIWNQDCDSAETVVSRLNEVKWNSKS